MIVSSLTCGPAPAASGEALTLVSAVEFDDSPLSRGSSLVPRRLRVESDVRVRRERANGHEDINAREPRLKRSGTADVPAAFVTCPWLASLEVPSNAVRWRC
jgi:hypothetical protein